MRRQVLVVCVVVAGILAWGYAGLSWWRDHRNRVILPPPAIDLALPAGASRQPVLSASDVLQPVELSPKLTPDEEAAEDRIRQFVEIAHARWPAVTLDGKSPAPTTATVLEQYTASIHDLFYDSFQRCAKPNALWRDEAAQWIDEYVTDGLKADRRAALRDTGQRLVDGGCDDWLVRYCLFRSAQLRLSAIAGLVVRLSQKPVIKGFAKGGWLTSGEDRIRTCGPVSRSRV